MLQTTLLVYIKPDSIHNINLTEGVSVKNYESDSDKELHVDVESDTVDILRDYLSDSEVQLINDNNVELIRFYT